MMKNNKNITETGKKNTDQQIKLEKVSEFD
jgi:hypothetical protein